MASNEPVRAQEVDYRAVAAFIASEGCPVSAKMTLGYAPDALAEAFARHRTLSQADGRREVEAKIKARIAEHPEPRDDEEQQYVWGLEFALKALTEVHQEKSDG